MASSSSAAASPSWVILAVVPHVSAPDVVADLSLALTAPSRVSPEPTAPGSYPNILVADRSGLLLLNAVQGRETTPLIHNSADRSLLLQREVIEGYFVCNAASGSAFRLPDPDPVGTILNPGNIGLITTSGGYMVAELQPLIGSDRATLLCFSSDTGTWNEKRLHYPLPCRPWVSSGVLSHDGEFWWVDLTVGILNLNPFDDEPKLRFFPLPEDKDLPFRPEGSDELEMCRCVKVSSGKLRFVEMTLGRRGPPKFTMWTLSPTDPPEGRWKVEYTVGFDTKMADDSYGATGLEVKLPQLAAIHPSNPGVAYFFLDAHLFGVDMLAARALVCGVHNVVQPPLEYLSSGFVHVWELPESLRT